MLNLNKLFTKGVEIKLPCYHALKFLEGLQGPTIDKTIVSYCHPKFFLHTHNLMKPVDPFYWLQCNFIERNYKATLQQLVYFNASPFEAIGDIAIPSQGIHSMQGRDFGGHFCQTYQNYDSYDYFLAHVCMHCVIKRLAIYSCSTMGGLKCIRW